MCKTECSNSKYMEGVDVITALKQLSDLKMKLQTSQYQSVSKNGDIKDIALPMQPKDDLEPKRKLIRQGSYHFSKSVLSNCYKRKFDIKQNEPVKALIKSKTIANITAEDLTLLQLLALNALELTAPASDLLLKSTTNSWVQLSGHEGSFTPASSNRIWKKCSSEKVEVKVYKQLMKDTVAEMVPRFYKDIDCNGEHYIEMQNLLHSFKNPAIMDIKMGTRTFLESEVQNTLLRSDLYEKMIKMDPNAPTSEERALGAITKLRYMQFRENMSSTAHLGFRIEGFKTRGKSPVKELKSIKSSNNVEKVISQFLEGRATVCTQLLERLKHIRSEFEQSEFFKKHEIVGSSLLLIHDGSKTGIWMIDFAKTLRLPEGLSVDHRSPWGHGNHEDGYLYGLDNLTLMLEKCHRTFKKNGSQ